ncbi:MAG TPA: NosD domain-containing protein, partial [Nakamurella sp.]|nr:NosD domain-containing protein [Nakamurella sp.]
MKSGRRLTSIVSIAGMVMALLTVVGVQQAAAASTFEVCASGCAFSTISGAVNIAAAGDTIVVDAGSYPESVTIDKALTLKGAQAGTAATDRTPGGPDETIIDVTGTAGARGITITANGVNVSGFEIKTSQTGTAIWMKSHSSNHAISDNILHAGQFAVALDSSNATFDGNKVLIGAYTTDGLINQSGPGSNWTVTNNSFALESGGTAPTGDYADINYSGDATDADNSQHDVTITGNTSTSGSTLIALAGVSHVTVTGNTSTGSRNGTAIYLGGSVVDAAITGNTIDNAVRGIKVDAIPNYGPNSDLTISGNQLLGNDTDLVLTDGAVDPAPLDVSGNWWGGPGGPSPSSIQASAGAVTYTPWCTDADCNNDSGDATHATRYVDDAAGATDENNDCGASASPCATIDHAIDAALPGDTVSVAAGNYQQHVTVAKPINLVGAGAENTTIDGISEQSGNAGVLHVTTLTSSGDVTISGFTFTGVSGVVGQPWPTVVIDDKNTSDTITFTDNKITNTDTASQHDTRGVLVHTVPGTRTTIEHNVISGVTQGILIENAGAVSVINNEFTQLNGLPWGSDTTYAAQGVLVMAHTDKTVADLVINGNTFHNYAGYGVLLKAGYSTAEPNGSITGEVKDNTFDLGAAQDPSPAGPVTSALYFRTYNADSALTATVTGNSGTVAGPSLPVVQDDAAESTFHVTASNNTIVVGEPNQVSIDFTPPASVVANGQPVEFHGVAHNNSTATIPGARYNLQLNVPDGVTADDITLRYWDSAVGTDGDWVIAQLTPSVDDSTVLTTHLKANSGFDLPPGSYTMDLTVSFATGFNGGTQATVGATATLVQVAADGTTINTLAAPVSHSTTVETLTVAGCDTPLATGTLTPADLNFAESKPEGHYAFLADGGLMIWTTGTDGSNRKIAGYVTGLHIPLRDIGAPALGYTPVDGTTMPGMNLWVDNGDADHPLAGMLVNEPNVAGSGYGDNWWATGGKDWGVGAVAGGGSDVSNAPLSAYVNRWPNAFVTQVGFSLGTLGAGQVSFAGPINSITYGCTEYSIVPGPLGSISGTVTAGGDPLEDVVVTATVPPASTGTGTMTLLATTATAGDTTVGTATTDS